MREQLAKSLQNQQNQVVGFDWPETVPRNYDELFRNYKDFIEKKVKSYNKVDRNLEDLLQEIYLKLIHSDILTKFVNRSADTLPESIPAEEAIQWLGMSWTQFHTALRRAGRFIPKKGKLFSKKAVFYSADIEQLDEAAKLVKRHFPRRLVHVQGLGFKAYLTQAIHNHFANFCRTRARKYKDLLLPSTAILTPTTSGYAHVGHNLEAFDWESRLVAMAINDEDLLSVVETVDREFAANDIDPSSDRGVELLDYMADGRTLREAIQTQERAEIRAKARALTLTG